MAFRQYFNPPNPPCLRVCSTAPLIRSLDARPFPSISEASRFGCPSSVLSRCRHDRPATRSGHGTASRRMVFGAMGVASASARTLARCFARARRPAAVAALRLFRCAPPLKAGTAPVVADDTAPADQFIPRPTASPLSALARRRERGQDCRRSVQKAAPILCETGARPLFFARRAAQRKPRRRRRRHERHRAQRSERIDAPPTIQSASRAQADDVGERHDALQCDATRRTDQTARVQPAIRAGPSNLANLRGKTRIRTVRDQCACLFRGGAV